MPRRPSSRSHRRGRAPRPTHAPRDRIRDLARVASALGDGEAAAVEVDRLWGELLEGRWDLVERFEQGSICYIVVSERPASHRGHLSHVEGLVVQMAAQGAANKTIAFDLDISTSTVATHLRRALSKLRPWSRHQLCMIQGLLFGAVNSTNSDTEVAGVDPDREGRASRTGRKGTTLRMTELVWPNDRLKVISTSSRGRVVRLTQGELDVAWSAASGMSNLDIALVRKSSARTIANQLASAFRKLGVVSRAELAAALLATPRDGTDG